MKKTVLQIQPQYARCEQWSTLAEQEGLLYEPIEFFMPHIFSDPLLAKSAETWYLGSGRVHSLHGAFIDVNPASNDPEVRKISQSRSTESCALAKKFGATHLVLHSSCFPILRGAYLDNWAAQCAEFYMKLAQEYDLTICVENSQDVDPTPLCTLMERVTDERVRVCLDIGHANCSASPLEEWFDRLAPYIAYLHLSDNMGKFDDHLPLGGGTVDWKTAHSLWQQLDRKMPATLEVGDITGVVASLSYLKENGYFGREM